MNGFWPRQSLSLTGSGRNHFFLSDLGHLITNGRLSKKDMEGSLFLLEELKSVSSLVGGGRALKGG